MNLDSDNKYVLIVAGEFPPIKTIGRIRTAKFVQHLRNEGWYPIVLTVTTTPETYDTSLENEIPKDLLVYRVQKTDIELEIINRLKSIFRKNSHDVTKSITNSKIKVPNQDSKNSGYQQRIRDLLISNAKGFLKYFIYIPDDYNLWALQATKVVAEICNTYNIRVVYTSLPPFSACYIGYWAKCKNNIPWVVDYRDLWFGDVLREWIPAPRKKLELFIEKYYVQKADAIISVSEQKTTFLKKLLTQTNAQWETITNGYDDEVFQPLLALPRKTDAYLNFVYTGRLFKNRKGYAFAEALGQLCQEQPAIKDKVRVHILGGVSTEIQERYDQLLAQYNIENLYNFTGDISYQKAMEAQVNADYLLLIVDTGATSDGVIPGKLFEYIASRRPIFALTNPGATQEIIEKSRAGFVVPAESVEQCKITLSKVLKTRVPDSLDLDDAYLAQFDRKQLTKRLAAIFDSLDKVDLDTTWS